MFVIVSNRQIRSVETKFFFSIRMIIMEKSETGLINSIIIAISFNFGVLETSF